MRKYLSAILIALCACASTAPAWAATETITGEVISLACYFNNKRNVGPAGFVCANADLKWEGNPPGLLTADGKIYQLAGPIVANNNAPIVPHIGHTVAVTGEVSNNEGLMVLTASPGDLKMVSAPSR